MEHVMWLALGAMLAADISLSCKHFSHLWMALWAVHIGLITTNWGPLFIKHCTWTYLLLTIALGRCYYPHFTKMSQKPRATVGVIQIHIIREGQELKAGAQSWSGCSDPLAVMHGQDWAQPPRQQRQSISVNMASKPNVQACNKENGCKEG